ncbi:MAG: iron-sulfur cluster assembly scaffold protein [Nanoarchaeota archaeon]|nr:iron-sulfur cluster assembly scaffold protein [Nanoarchaeota archaeon]
MYSKKIIKRFENPRFVGELKNPDAVGEVGNPRCGDVMRIYLKIENGKIKDVKFKTYGCIMAIVASDAMCELALGKTLEEAGKISSYDIISKMGGKVPTIKVHCSVLGMQALKKAIDNYGKNNKKIYT